MQIKIEITGARSSGKTEVVNKIMREFGRIGEVKSDTPSAVDTKETVSFNFKPFFDTTLPERIKS